LSDNSRLPIYVAIIGTDTLLAARPVDWVQLTHACRRAGFDFVAPVSWGEELIASHIGERMAVAPRSTMVASSCPFVSEAVRDAPPVTPILRTVSPPVACARYLRAAFSARPVHVTYIGACPGAVDAEVDEQFLPEVLFAKLAEAGIDPAALPHHLDAQLPVERARYASIPGGAPSAEWLMVRAGVRLVESAPIAVDAVTKTFDGDAVLMDLALSCRCVCARNRWGAAQVEPTRATQPVVKAGVPVTDEPVPAPEVVVPPPPPTKDRRATFAENGLSAGEAAELPPVPTSEPPAPTLATTTREPW
jgi:hypothetical protein